MIREYIIKISDEVMENEIADRPQELVRCKDCKHRPVRPENCKSGFDLKFPDYECPFNCEDPYYSWYPDDNWFCADGERIE